MTQSEKKYHSFKITLPVPVYDIIIELAELNESTLNDFIQDTFTQLINHNLRFTKKLNNQSD